MNTKGLKITQAVGALIMIIAAILGVVYVLTGQTFAGKFIGHFANRMQSALKGEDSMPEVLAFAAMGVFFVGMITSSAGIFISQKGMTKSEKKIAAKDFKIFMSGLFLGVISVMALAILAPKEPFYFDDAKSMAWYWLVTGLLIFSIGLIIFGYIQWYKISKAPLISDEVKKLSTKDEF